MWDAGDFNKGNSEIVGCPNEESVKFIENDFDSALFVNIALLTVMDNAAMLFW